MNRLFIPLAAIILSACTRDEELLIAPSQESLGSISITPTTSATRGMPVNEPDDMVSFGVYCAYNGTEPWSTASRYEKMENSRYYLDDDNEWSIDGDKVPWDYQNESDLYSFTAYSPHQSDASGVITQIESGELVIYYTLPTNSAAQPDLLYAIPQKNLPPQLDSGVELTFCHALSCVSFIVVSSTNTKIKEISISGIVDSGTLRWDRDDNLLRWSLGEPSQEAIAVAVDDYSLGTNSTAQVNSDQGHLMMLPQELKSDANVLVTLDNGDTQSLSIEAGTIWEAGARYQYFIRLESSDCNIVYTSAQISNCYIIHPTPGSLTTVQIPIEDRINDFWKNYSSEDKGKKITNNSSTTDFYAEMLWNDFNDDITFKGIIVEDDEGKYSVQVEIPAACEEGNLVFAVKSCDATTLWTWHLWVTTYDPDLIAAVNRSMIVPDRDLDYSVDGYEGAVHRYKDAAGYDVWSDMYSDKFIMDRNIGERSESSEQYGQISLYYQFGRSAPFPGDYANYYGVSCMPIRTVGTGTSYESVIFSKDFLYNSSTTANWNELRTDYTIWYDDNLASAGYRDGKSIFDPSPLGWRLPVSDTWSSFNGMGTSQSGCEGAGSVGIYQRYGMRDATLKGALCDVEGDDDVVGYVWSANQSPTANYGYCLYSSVSDICAPNEIYLSSGCPVRAIQE